MTNMEKPPRDISVVICTRNRSQELRKTLESLAAVRRWSRTDLRKVEGELIVVDNGSTDETEAVLRDYRHPWLEMRRACESAPGLARARNRAVRSAGGQAIVFTDDDIRFPEGWLEEMATPILQGEADAVRGGVRLAAHLQRDWMTRQHKAYLADTGSTAEAEFVYLIGANMAVRRSVFEAGCTFDEDLGAGRSGACEEIALSIQLRDRGLRVISLPEVAVEHHPSEDRLERRSWRKRMFQEGTSMAIVYRRYGGYRRRGAFLHLPVDLLRVAASEIGSRRRPVPATPAELEQWKQLAFHYELIRQFFMPAAGREAPSP